jgi:hypothetical protein
VIGHVTQTIQAMEQNVYQIQTKKPVHEQSQTMQQQQPQQVLLKHGMEQYGIQQLEHGEKIMHIVIMTVIQTIHGIQQHKAVKQTHKNVQYQTEYEHKYGIEQIGEHVM